MSSQDFVNTLKRLIAREVRTLLPRWRWGKVISLSPIAVELDAEQGTLPDVKTNVAPVIVNDRVQVMTWRERSRIVAVSGGAGSGTRSFATLALAKAANLPVGAQVWVVSEDQGYVKGNGGWAAISRARILRGRVTITPSAANVPTAGAVVFPEGFFTAQPTMTATAITNGPGTTVTGVSAGGVTTSGADIWVTRINEVTTAVDWTATQI